VRVYGFEALKPLADVFSSKTGAPRAPSRPLPQAEATVFKENTSPLTRSLKKADVREVQKSGCERAGVRGRRIKSAWKRRKTKETALLRGATRSGKNGR
jgi:hypothetical protein